MREANREIRILNVIPDERLGGPQYRVLQVAKELQGRDFVTIVATPKGDRAFAKLLEEADIAGYQLGNFKRLPSSLAPFGILKWFLFLIPGLVSLIRLIRRERIDIVHANGAMSLQAPLAARISGRKLVWHLNDTFSPKLLRFLLRPAFCLLPHKLALASEAVGEYYLGDSGLIKKSSVLYPPIDTSRFFPDETRVEEYRKEFGIAENENIVGLIGNINPEKGHEYFISAAQTIKNKFPRVKFLVVGKKLETQEQYWQELQSMISRLKLADDVILTNYRTDIPQILNLMDVFVLASTSEAAPIAVLEAMACGKPIVATRVGGVPELVIDGETGIVVTPGDPEAIAETVLYFLNHVEKVNEMGSKGRLRAIERFDLSVCTKRHEQIYTNIL